MTAEPAVVGRDGEVAIVALRDEIDIAVEPEVTRVFMAVLAGRPRALVVDLSGVSFMDCAGLHALGVLRAKAAEIGIDPVLAALPPAVTRLLAPLGLSGAFPTAASVEQAVAAARGASGVGREIDSTAERPAPVGG